MSVTSFAVSFTHQEAARQKSAQRPCRTNMELICNFFTLWLTTNF